MIKKFEFRLEQVLRHRANMEELKERALAEVEAQLVREQDRWSQLVRAIGRIMNPAPANDE